MRGDTRCVEGRLYRHDPQHDDPDLETDIGQCPECEGKDCQAMNAEQQDFLNELREYFADRQDADHDGTGYVANDEMKLLIRLNELFPEEGK